MPAPTRLSWLHSSVAPRTLLELVPTDSAVGSFTTSPAGNRISYVIAAVTVISPLSLTSPCTNVVDASLCADGAWAHAAAPAIDSNITRFMRSQYTLDPWVGSPL